MGFQVCIAVDVHNMLGRVAEGGVCLYKYTSQSWRVNAEAAGSNATLITIYGNTRSYITEKYYLLFSSVAFGLNNKTISHRTNKIKIKRYCWQTLQYM